MSKLSEAHNADSHRIAISTFMIATVIAVWQLGFTTNTPLFVPVTLFLIGLHVSAALAFLYILAKGYELRHSKTANNLLDRYNYILYDIALKAYVLVSLVLGVIYILSLLIDQAEDGNIFAKISTWLAIPLIAAAMSYRDFQELFVALHQKLKKKKSDS